MLEWTVTESICAQFSFLPKVTGKKNDNLQSTFHTEGEEGERMAKTTEGREVDKNYPQVSVNIGINSLSGSFTTQLRHKLNHNTTSAFYILQS